MNKLSDNEIIGTFEKIAKEQNSNFLKTVIDLINRQKTEIERLQKAIKVQDIMIEQQDYKIKSKSEVIKEFAERLKGYAKELKIGDNIYLQVVGAGRIDNLVKEMTENITKVEHDSLCETETYKGGE